MKKKIYIVILIICLLVVLMFAMYLIDRNRMENNKPELFSNWGYSYVPPIDYLPEEEIKSAIINYIVEKGDNEKHHENAKTFAGMNVYLIQEEKRDICYTIYAWVLEEKYYIENNEIKQDSGSSIPHKFTLVREDDKFAVTDVKTPRDGSYYADDMKKIFPSSVRNDMEKIYTDGTMESLQLDIKNQTENYFNKR